MPATVATDHDPRCFSLRTAKGGFLYPKLGRNHSERYATHCFNDRIIVYRNEENDVVRMDGCAMRHSRLACIRLPYLGSFGSEPCRKHASYGSTRIAGSTTRQAAAP